MVLLLLTSVSSLSPDWAQADIDAIKNKAVIRFKIQIIGVLIVE
jgi:hypothetical protein